MTRIGLKLLGIALLLGAGITFTFYSTSAWLHARDFSRFDFGNEQRRKKLRTEFEALTTTVKETLDKFGVNFLAKQAALRESYSNKGQHSRPNFALFSPLFAAACLSPQKWMLLVFPIRDRWQQMKKVLETIVPSLHMRSICTFVVVVEQTEYLAFNKGILMNAAFIEAGEFVPFDCVIFHDVDLVPVDPNSTQYDCPVYPRHLSGSIDKFNFQLPYLGLIGGILAVPVDHFLRVNGFSNMFWGWGGEDDDLYERFIYVGLPITRPITKPTIYKMLPHQSSVPSDFWRKNALLQVSLRRYRLDGLNSAVYKVVTNKTISATELFKLKHLRYSGISSHVIHLLIDPQPIGV